MANLQKVKEALQFYANFPYRDGLVYVKPEDVQPPIDWLKVKPNDLIQIESKRSYDKGDKAKEAVAELNEFMERLESDKLVEDIADNDSFMNAVIDAANIFPDIKDKELRNIAQAAINVIKGNDDSR